MIHIADFRAGSDSYARRRIVLKGVGRLQAQVTPMQNPAVPDLDAKGLLLRDALAILTVVGALAAFYGIIKLVSYLSGIPFP